MEIKNAVVLVTGANRGLGLSFATALLAAGALKVYAAARDPSSVTLQGVIPLKLDVTNADDIARVARDCPDITLLINNAAIATGTSLLDPASTTAARREFETNVLGPLELTKALAPTLARHGGGAIVNVLSVLSWLNIPSFATYAVSKAAAWSVTNGLRAELAAQKTQVVAVHVGYMDTDMSRSVNAPKTSPEAVVQRTLEALRANEQEVLADDMSVHVRRGLGDGVYLGVASDTSK